MVETPPSPLRLALAMAFRHFSALRTEALTTAPNQGKRLKESGNTSSQFANVAFPIQSLFPQITLSFGGALAPLVMRITGQLLPSGSAPLVRGVSKKV